MPQLLTRKRATRTRYLAPWCRYSLHSMHLDLIWLAEQRQGCTLRLPMGTWHWWLSPVHYMLSAPRVHYAVSRYWRKGFIDGTSIWWRTVCQNS